MSYTSDWLKLLSDESLLTLLNDLDDTFDSYEGTPEALRDNVIQTFLYLCLLESGVEAFTQIQQYKSEQVIVLLRRFYTLCTTELDARTRNLYIDGNLGILKASSFNLQTVNWDFA